MFRNNQLERLSFPYVPYSNYLLEELPIYDKDKASEKVEALMEAVPDLIRKAKIEYEYKKFFINMPFFGPMVFYTELWKTLSFYLTIILNLMALLSFNGYGGADRLMNATLFDSATVAQTNSLFDFCGSLQFMFSLFIFIAVFFKRIKYNKARMVSHFEIEEAKRAAEMVGMKRRRLKKRPAWRKCYYFSRYLLFDFQFFYYLGFMVFSLLGLYVHPFCYAYHLLDVIIKSAYLKNVLRAVYRPRFELLHTFFLFICLQYIFAIFAYTYFGNQFPDEACTSFFQCFLVMFDKTFKTTGGVGGFLTLAYPSDFLVEGSHIEYARFVWDNLFNIIMVIGIVQIISGIIIDTFGALRHEQ